VFAILTVVLPSDGALQTTFLQMVGNFPNDYKFNTILPGVIINGAIILVFEILLMGYVILPCANKR
jgi:hypothetical protein